MARTNKVIDSIRTRRSVRGYQVGPVTREQLELIVDCGRLAPSSFNEQRWEFVVITDHGSLADLAALMPENGPFIADAAACIVVAGNRDHAPIYLDGAAATENMLLAIHSLGLASCWVQAYDKTYTDAVKQLLGVPDDLVLVSILPVGVAFEDVECPPKRPLEDVLHWEKF